VEHDGDSFGIDSLSYIDSRYWIQTKHDRHTHSQAAWRTGCLTNIHMAGQAGDKPGIRITDTQIDRQDGDSPERTDKQTWPGRLGTTQRDRHTHIARQAGDRPDRTDTHKWPGMRGTIQHDRHTHIARQAGDILEITGTHMSRQSGVRYTWSGRLETDQT
jgi:hypothetical protein